MHPCPRALDARRPGKHTGDGSKSNELNYLDTTSTDSLYTMSRPQRARRSYTQFFKRSTMNVDADNDGDSSESDFNPKADNQAQQDSPSYEENEDDTIEEDGYEDEDGGLLDSTSGARPTKSTQAAKGSKSQRPSRRAQPLTKSTEPSTPGHPISAASRPQKPGPGPLSTLLSKEHRHRPTCLWYPETEVYRLVEQPQPCHSPALLPTVSSRHPQVAHRVNRAWMYSISSGPRWELIEDRAFYKEEYTHYDPATRTGRQLRPPVYQDVIPGGYTLLTAT